MAVFSVLYPVGAYSSEELGGLIFWYLVHYVADLNPREKEAYMICLLLGSILGVELETENGKYRYSDKRIIDKIIEQQLNP